MQNLKHLKRIPYFLLLLLVGNLFTGCFTDKDDEVQTPTASSINDFIWKGLNAFYLYKEEVNDLQDDRFSSNEDYATFLNVFESPENIFNALRTKRIVGEIPVDDFSFLVDDYVALEQAFDGITKNHGMEYGLRIMSKIYSRMGCYCTMCLNFEKIHIKEKALSTTCITPITSFHSVPDYFHKTF